MISQCKRNASHKSFSFGIRALKGTKMLQLKKAVSWIPQMSGINLSEVFLLFLVLAESSPGPIWIHVMFIWGSRTPPFLKFLLCVCVFCFACFLKTFLGVFLFASIRSLGHFLYSEA